MTLGQLAALLGGELHGPAELVIQRPGAYDEGRPDEIVVAFDAAAAELAEQTAAGAVVLPAGVRSAKPYVTVGDPKQALAAIVTAFSPGPPPAAGVHPTAIVDPSVALPGDLTIGPYAVVGAQVVIGEGCRLAAIVGDRRLVPARRRSRPSPRVTLIRRSNWATGWWCTAARCSEPMGTAICRWAAGMSKSHSLAGS